MNFLNEIIEVKKDEIKKLKQYRSLSSFKDEMFFDASPLPFKNSLINQNRLSLIAEIKKASPSKGIILKDFNHLTIAETYMECNVDAISVLTDQTFFKGHLNFLSDIAKIKNAPLLRKDFIIDEYQVFEAKANGADAILLISEALSPTQINELTCAAADCKLEVLLELHSESQLAKIDFSQNNLIGINNRNLETFEVNLNTTFEILDKIFNKITIVSESGITNKKDLDQLKTIPVNAVLVGEHFMKAKNIKSSVKEFLDWCAL